MKIIRKIDGYIVKVEEYILSYAIIIMAVMLIADVLSRNVLNKSIYFAQEVNLFLIYLITFMGISYAARKGRHIRMSAFFDMLPHRPKKMLAVFISIFTAVVLLIFTYYSYEYTLSVYERGRVTSALEIPAFLLYVFVPVGFLLGAIQYLRNAWINLTESEVYIGTEKMDHASNPDQTSDPS
ncbi:TRAP transporter permease DctQ [Fischerella thermalis CCMEE 5273]|nr:TRAP transporter permease DctQ [Fischerella thermalis CCMEE 5273]